MATIRKTKIICGKRTDLNNTQSTENKRELRLPLPLLHAN